MRRVWATVLAVWATLAILTVLAWTRPQPAPLPQAAPTTLVVKGKNGTTRLVAVQSHPAAKAHATTRSSPPPPP